MIPRKQLALDFSDDDSQSDVSLYSHSDSDDQDNDHVTRRRPPPRAKPAAKSGAAGRPARQGRAQSRKPRDLPRDGRGKLRSMSPVGARSGSVGPRRENPVEKREPTFSYQGMTRFAFVGPAGAGKTSLLGYMSCLSKSGKGLPLCAVEATACKAGRPLAKYAWLLDRTVHEREDGTSKPREVLVDMNSWMPFFSRVPSMCVDCPGGSGAASLEASLHAMVAAQVIVVVVSAIAEEFESGIGYVGTLLRGFGALQLDTRPLFFLVNKLDAINYDVDAFVSIRERLEKLYEQSTGKKLQPHCITPMAAALGENLVRLAPWSTGMTSHCVSSTFSQRNSMSWSGYCPQNLAAFGVEEVMCGDVIAGRGTPQFGMTVMPLGVTVTVKEIRIAATGKLCTHLGSMRGKLTISPVCPDMFPGCVLVAPGMDCGIFANVVKFKVYLQTLSHTPVALSPDTPLTMCLHNFRGRVKLLAVSRLRGLKGSWSTSSGRQCDRFVEGELVLESLDGPVPAYLRSFDRYPNRMMATPFNSLFLYQRKHLVALGIVLERMDERPTTV